MAQYEFEGPDGKTYLFDGPEGTVAKAAAAALPGFPAKAKALATDPQAQATALRVGLPIAAGALTGGLGVAPAIGMAGLMGAGAEGLAQVREQVAGLPTAPKTSAEAAKKMGKEGLINALMEGAGRGLYKAGTKVVDWAKGWAASRGAKQSAGATAEELKRVYSMSPEVVEPGYYRQRIDTYTADLPKKVGAGFEQQGAKVNKALAAEGKKVAMRSDELMRGVDDALGKLSSVKTPDAEQAVKAVKELADGVAFKTRVDPLTGKGGTLTVNDIVKFENDMWELTKRGGSDVRHAMGGLREQLDATLTPFKKVTDARASYKVYRQASDVLEDFLGVTPKAKPAEIASRVELVANKFLSLPEPQKDAIRKALDTVDSSGSLTERLEKLAAAGGGEGRLTAEQAMLPSMGVGNVGWSVANPGAAAQALGATAALRAASAAPVVRGLLKAATSTPTQKMILPGLKQSATVLRVGKAAWDRSKDKK